MQSRDAQADGDNSTQALYRAVCSWPFVSKSTGASKPLAIKFTLWNAGWNCNHAARGQTRAINNKALTKQTTSNKAKHIQTNPNKSKQFQTIPNTPKYS
jgi:hypothetical protein